MKEELTKRQQQIYDFIKEKIKTSHLPPTIREIGEAVGLSSTSTVHGHLKKLEEKGYIIRDSSKTRAIEIVGMEINEPQQTHLGDSNITVVPIVGSVTAGEPILAVENIEGNFPIPDEFVNEGNDYFMLKIDGESMIKAGIYDHDYVLVEKNSYAKDGDIIVALVEDEYATVKTFYKEKNRIKLQPENDTMDPIYSDRVDILGHVKGVFRKM
jgi:repressor LexA